MSDATPPPSPARPERKATLRFDQRLMARLSALFVGFILLMLILAGYRLFSNFKSQRDVSITRNNMRALYGAFAAYAQDWGERLPPANNWTDAIAGYLHAPPNTPGGAESFLTAPSDAGKGAVGYAYNDLASCYELEPTNEKDRKKRIPPEYLTLLIEKQGVSRNATTHILPQEPGLNEDQLYKALDFPHYSDDKDNATTLMLMATGRIKQHVRRDFRPSAAP